MEEVITELADRQAKKLIAVQKKKNMSDEERAKRIEKQRKRLQKELEVVAKGITDKCVSTMDDIRAVR